MFDGATKFSTHRNQNSEVVPINFTEQIEFSFSQKISRS